MKELLIHEIKYVETILGSVLTTLERKMFEQNLKMLKKRLDTLGQNYYICYTIKPTKGYRMTKFSRRTFRSSKYSSNTTRAIR